MPLLSVIVITRNEEKNIKEFLDMLSWVEEIVLVDDESTDRTVQIASTYPNVKIFKRRMKNGFGPQKQYALEQATGEWILVLDCDERITEKCKEEILKKISFHQYDGFYFLRKNMIFGKFISDYKPRALRLFRKRKGKFTDAGVHENVIVKGKIGVINEPIIHYSRSTENIENYIDTLNLYTLFSAQEMFTKGRKVSSFGFFLYFIIYPIYIFLRVFLFKKFYAKGIVGIVLATLRMFEGVIGYFKLWELSRKDI